MAFSKIAPFKVLSAPEAEPRSELEQLQTKWAAALEEGFQSRCLPVVQLKQDNAHRLFYTLKQDNRTESLKTTVNMRLIRDDLQVYDAQVTYTNIANTGIKEEATFKLIRDPKTVGVDPLATVQLVHRIINGRSP